MTVCGIAALHCKSKIKSEGGFMETDRACLQSLENILRQYRKLAVAVSGGMDSTFLAYIAKKIIGDTVLAISVRSALNIDSELKQFAEFAQKYQIRYTIIEVDILNNLNVVRNAPDRCYHCKKEIFRAIMECAIRQGFDIIADGSNCSDLDDFRPGMQALHEFGIVSPLKEAGCGKSDIIRMAHSLGVNLPVMYSNSCFATRIAYGIPLTREVLEMVRQGERFLAEIGIAPVRVRYHHGIARIEMPFKYIQKMLNDDLIINDVITRLKGLGFQYVTIDLEGYRRGSMNIF